MSEASLSRREIRAVDLRAVTEFGMNGLVLMENAGRGVADHLSLLGINGLVVVCCGKGNNGGDGFVIARHLEAVGFAVRVLLFATPSELTGDALANWRILEAADTPRLVLGSGGSLSEIEHHLASADWVVDALLGTGTVGEIRDPYRTAIRAINRAAQRVLAVDLPSGLDCDTGLPLSTDIDGAAICVRAQHTVTFVAFKQGFSNPSSLQFTGAVHAARIGIPRLLFDDVMS